MKTYSIKIRSDAKTHWIGELIVMAENEEQAIDICSSELNTDSSDFHKPIEMTSGLVCRSIKSAWEGYH